MTEFSLKHKNLPQKSLGRLWLCPSPWDGAQGLQGKEEGAPDQATTLVPDGPAIGTK